jgi:signal transduction histidine kinase/ligand-binding sensor domain-containing protein
MKYINLYSTTMSRLFYTFFLITFLFSCNKGSNTSALAEQSSEYSQPKSSPLEFIKTEKTVWTDVNPDSVKPIKEIPFDFDKLPTKPFYLDGFKPLAKPTFVSRFNWETLPDTAFDIDKIPALPLQYKTFKLTPPTHLKATKPKINKAALMGILQMGLEEELMGDRVLSLFEDSKGFIWMGTRKGICRYDGAYYDIFSLNGEKGTNSEKIYRITEDNKGRIWMHCSTYICCLDVENGILKKIDLNATGFDIIKDSQGYIWVGMNGINSGIYLIDPANETIKFITKTHGLKLPHIIRISEDANGLIWLCGGVSNLDIIDRTHKKIKHLNLPNDTSNRVRGTFIYSLLPHNEKMIISTTKGGIDIIDTKKGLVEHLGKEQGILNLAYNLTKDDAGNIWLATESQGAYVYDDKSHKIKQITEKEGLSNNHTENILFDSRGQMWIGTLSGGLNVINLRSVLPQNINEINENSGNLVTNETYNTVQNKLNQVWINYQAVQGLDINPHMDIIDLQSQTVKFFDVPKWVNTTARSFIMSDKKNQIWVADNQKTLHVINTKTKKVKRIELFKEKTPLTFPFNMIEDANGKIWILLGSGGVMVYNPEKHSFKILEGFKLWNSIFCDSSGNVYIMTPDGLFMIDATQNTLKCIKTDPGFYSMVEDSLHNIWGATEKGVLRFDFKNNSVLKFTPNEGLTANEAYQLVYNQGKIYAGMSNGINEISETNGKWSVKSYGRAQGFYNLDVNGGAGLTLPNGKMLWGIQTSVVTMNVPKIDTTVPLAYITGLSLGGKSQSFIDNKLIKRSIDSKDSIWSADIDTSYLRSNLPKENGYLQQNNISWDSPTGFFILPVNLILPYHQNQIGFTFTGMHLSDPDKTRYQYILEGIDKEWNPITSNAYSDNYRDLPSGKYTFQVRSKGFNDIWSKPTAFSFTITPPFWQTWWAYLFYAVAFAYALRTYIQYRSRALKEKNIVLEEKVHQRTEELESSLKELKSTQTQLIQKEKLASLGELTAGIAHEIQNPLNFVNNFSELSVDLAKELKEEIDKVEIPEKDKDYIGEILTDLSQNQEKINHHGKRASSIVKGMLEHSRASTGVKEMTDINALADEYFRLSYHGLRAKDKDFNATMETDFDKNLPKINVIPQDMGRVLLNLFNNAFYAVHERQQLSESLKLSENYTPSVFLTTQLIDNQIVIKVRDNGTGMPESVRAKVFQPFFTTKPTGSGTGLGLSLAYDIVTKGHGGNLEVISKENEFTEFMIKLPL